MDRILPPDFPDLTGASCVGLFDLVDSALERPGGAAGDDMKRLCSGCPVREACLEWALAHPEHGVWGGTSPYLRTTVNRGSSARSRQRRPAARPPGRPATRPAAGDPPPARAC